MDDRLKRVKEIVTELLEKNRVLIDENFELKRRAARLEDALDKALNNANKVVDVVRCKDCKYCKIEDWDGDNFRVCTRDQHIRSSSWFCAAGERSSDNG